VALRAQHFFNPLDMDLSSCDIRLRYADRRCWRVGRAEENLSASRIVWRTVAYAWASPNTLLGLIAGLAVLGFGGRARLVCGNLEFYGGRLGTLVSSAHAYSFEAITFGHAILGVSAAQLEAARQHEHVHVAQYERWGPLFLPAYGASSLWQLVQGRHVYRDNFFERQAYAQSKADLAA
jgi:hypothetical protein